MCTARVQSKAIRPHHPGPGGGAQARASPARRQRAGGRRSSGRAAPALLRPRCEAILHARAETPVLPPLRGRGRRSSGRPAAGRALHTRVSGRRAPARAPGEESQAPRGARPARALCNGGPAPAPRRSGRCARPPRGRRPQGRQRHAGRAAPAPAPPQSARAAMAACLRAWCDSAPPSTMRVSS
jgi:hypothetical protein